MKDLKDAIAEAKRLTASTGRKHVVRNQGFSTAPDYTVTPLYESGGEEQKKYDRGYDAYGAIAWWNP